MKVTIDEIVQTLVSCGASQLASAIREHGISPPEGMCIVPIEDCPNCDNGGVIRYNGGDMEQCQFCYEMPNSRFNQNEAVIEASKP